MKSSAMRDLMAVTARPEIISLAGGLPAPDTFDVPGLPSDGLEHRLIVYDDISELAETRIVLGTPAETPVVVTTRGPIVESWVSALVGGVGLAGILASCGVVIFIARQRRLAEARGRKSVV